MRRLILSAVFSLTLVALATNGFSQQPVPAQPPAPPVVIYGEQVIKANGKPVQSIQLSGASLKLAQPAGKGDDAAAQGRDPLL